MIAAAGLTLFFRSVLTDPHFVSPAVQGADTSSPAAEPEDLRAPRAVATAGLMAGADSDRKNGVGPLVLGYYVNWDKASLGSLRQNLQHLTHLVPQWLFLGNGKGELEDTSDPAVEQLAREARLPILAMVTNYREGWQAGEIHRVLQEPAARATLVDNLYAALVRHRFAGINVDFEQISPGDRDHLTAFMSELGAKLKPAGLLITQSVPPDDDAFDLKRLAAVNDYLVTMLYDEHDEGGAPGPIGSQAWVDRQIATLAATLPREKTVIGLGNYGYEWTADGGAAKTVGFVELISTADRHNAVIQWDPVAENAMFRYQSGGLWHDVWFLDAITALNQTRAAARAGFPGVALWRLGAEDPSVWSAVSRERWPDADGDRQSLTQLRGQPMVTFAANGEILRVTATPHAGRRRIWRTDDGDAAEQYESYPSPFVIEGLGGSREKVLALTFDDGPDPRYTPLVLDVLRSYGVPATFFVTGVNAEASPELLRRMYSEGHEIGNHTYSHPNTAEVPHERTRLELNATQRIIQHVLGVSTALFRAPFNVDSEPQTPEELALVLRAQELGYLTVSARIDPGDWMPGASADRIVSEFQRQQSAGLVVLLHDAGGDRSATVAALPRIIESVRSRGHRFVTVSGLLGRQRVDVMPPVPDGDRVWARIAGHAFTAKSLTTHALGVLLLSVIGLAMLRSVAYGGLAVWQSVRARRRRFDGGFRPPVSVIIAACNEERVIVWTVESVLRNGYADLEVVVVSDGSTDRTVEALQQAFAGNPRVRILAQAVRRGKAAALNLAVGLAAHDILISIDADTALRSGAIGKLVRHFSDPAIGAVSGNVRVGNRRNWITRFQSIEYVYGFNLDRRALDVLNAITVVPGAAGAWRKSLIERLDGFPDETLAEDTDLTLAMRRLGCQIRYDEEAVADTEVPEDTRSLVRQRFRWSFGTLQAAWKHRDATFRPRYGSLGFIALPSIWLFQLGLALLAPLADAAMVIALVAGTWRMVLGYYLALFTVELLAGCLAYALEKEKPRDLLLLPVQRIYYRQLMHYLLAKVIFAAIKGRLVTWGKLERRGRLQSTGLVVSS